MGNFRAEEAFDDFKSGRIDEWDLKRELQNIYGDCSCMRESIEHSIRDSDWYDSHGLSTRLDDSKRDCDYKKYYENEE